MAEIIAGRYELIKSIGHGGMADVYVALDKILNREVAIKILKADMSSDPVSLERFAREANAQTKISHPNIVDIYDVGDDDNRHYIVMEYIKGYTLKQLIKRRGAIPPREAVWMIKQLSSALLEAHKNGLVHRDVKSQNVLIKDDGTVKLADFGIAILNNAMQLTSKDSVLGSVHYLAPEISKGSPASMASDIYSLGIVFYELLTGDVPYKGDTPVQVALKHIKEPLPDVRKFNPDIPQSVANVLMKATAKNVNDRYENIALMIKDLNTCLNPERLNEPKIILDNDSNTQYNISATADELNSLKKKKRNRVITISLISLFSIAAIFLILVINGVFSINKSKRVEVPEVLGLSSAVAIDAIDASGLTVNYPIEYELTDSTAEGIVISISPSQGSLVEKGSSVNLTVSNGTYSIMDNYVGMNIEDVKKILNNTKILIKTKTNLSSSKQEGTILSQTGLFAGDKYDANVQNIVEFEVSGSQEINVPALLNETIDNAIEVLELNDLKYQLIEKEKEEFSSSCKANSVCKMEPEEGTIYKVSDDSIIKIYYYLEAK